MRSDEHIGLRAVASGLTGLIVAAALTLVAHAADYDPASPSTYLFDTGACSPAALPATGLEPAAGWTLVPEDNTTRKFQGDAVMRNDRLIVVVRVQGAGTELYGQSPTGAKLRAVLAPLASPDGSAGALSDLRILENGPAAVVLSATYTGGDGKPCALTCRLTPGQPMVELRPGAGTTRLMVRNTTRYLVVTDFFGDDMVFRADDVSRSRLRLPAENYLLQLPDGGDGLLMCVWQAGGEGPTALRAADSGPTFAGCEFEAVPDKSLWVACLEGPALWHERRITDPSVKAALALDWKPPFPAKWRSDLCGPHGAAMSWYFRGADETGEPAQALSPCCIEAGQAVVRLPLPVQGGSSPATLLTYAMDRNRETPLTAFCPIDVLRNTLGVGPCQYILQTEGFAVESSPTPDSAMTWIEKQFSRKKQKKTADEIRELLDQMFAHIGHTQARIEQYGRTARDVRLLCKSADVGQASKMLDEIAARIEQVATAAQPTPQERAAKVASAVANLAAQEGSPADCEKLGAEARAIGAGQDRALATCRMTVRWLKQSAVMLGEEDPRAAGLAGEIRQRAERMLRPQAPNAADKP